MEWLYGFCPWCAREWYLLFFSECVPFECLCGFHCYQFVLFGVELIMMGFHGCCLRALGLLLWWVSEGTLDLAFVCECWFLRVRRFMIYCYCVYCLLRWLSLQGWFWRGFVDVCSWRIRSGWANVVRFLSVWWMCCLLMDFIGFMFSMNAVVVWVHDAGFLGLFIMNVMWQSFCDYCEQCMESCLSGIVKWDDARSWIICCAKRRGLTGNGRIVMFAFSMVSFMSAGDVIMNAWDDSTRRSYLYVRDDDEDCDDILWIELLMMFTVRRLGISMSRVKGIFHVVMIAFITEIQEQPDNRGGLA